jgi:hypothetical protein
MFLQTLHKSLETLQFPALVMGVLDQLGSLAPEAALPNVVASGSVLGTFVQG